MTVIDENDEILTYPSALIARIREGEPVYGDCDDAAMLVAAMAGSVGFPVRFKAVFPTDDGSYQHVFTEVEVGKVGWIPLDTTIPHAPVYPSEFLVEEV